MLVLRTYRKIAIAAIVVAAPTALLASAFKNEPTALSVGEYRQLEPRAGLWSTVRDTASTMPTARAELGTNSIGLAAQAYRLAKVLGQDNAAANVKTTTRQGSDHPSPKQRLIANQQEASSDKAAREGAPAQSPGSAPLSQIADSIHVRFQGFKEINGTYRLNEDETVSIPGVGRISIAGLTAQQLEAALVKRILGSTGREAPVSVEVSTYRHVFVDGVVDKPGSFQWQRGMTVIKAVSMTGGIYRPKTGGGSWATTSPVAQRGQLDIARLSLAQAIVRQARISAELNDKELIRLPERLIGIYGANRANELITAEQRILDNRRSVVKARLATLDAQHTSVNAEVDRLQILAKGMSDRTRNYAKLLSKLRQTHRAGGISNQRLFDVENRLGDLEEKLASTNVQLVRARSEKQLIDSKRSELTDSRRERMIEEEIKAKNDIGMYQIKYDVALDAIRSTAGGVAVGPGQVSDASQLVYEIIRRSKDGEQRISAERLDLLLPGDTLVVSQPTAEPISPTKKRKSQLDVGDIRQKSLPPATSRSDGKGANPRTRFSRLPLPTANER